MPIYEYRCQECQQIFEQWQRDFNDQDRTCPVCGGKSQRLISNTSFVLKGSGWYVTDYCRNGAASGGNGNQEQKPEAKTDVPAKETTVKTTPEAKPAKSSSANDASGSE